MNWVCVVPQTWNQEGMMGNTSQAFRYQIMHLIAGGEAIMKQRKWNVETTLGIKGKIGYEMLINSDRNKC